MMPMNSDHNAIYRVIFDTLMLCLISLREMVVIIVIIY